MCRHAILALWRIQHVTVFGCLADSRWYAWNGKQTCWVFLEIIVCFQITFFPIWCQNHWCWKFGVEIGGDLLLIYVFEMLLEDGELFFVLLLFWSFALSHKVSAGAGYVGLRQMDVLQLQIFQLRWCLWRIGDGHLWIQFVFRLLQRQRQNLTQRCEIVLLYVDHKLVLLLIHDHLTLLAQLWSSAYICHVVIYAAYVQMLVCTHIFIITLIIRLRLLHRRLLWERPFHIHYGRLLAQRLCTWFLCHFVVVVEALKKCHFWEVFFDLLLYQVDLLKFCWQILQFIIICSMMLLGLNLVFLYFNGVQGAVFRYAQVLIRILSHCCLVGVLAFLRTQIGHLLLSLVRRQVASSSIHGAQPVWVVLVQILLVFRVAGLVFWYVF